MKQNDFARENDFSRKSKKYRTRYLDELGKLYHDAKKATIEAKVKRLEFDPFKGTSK